MRFFKKVICFFMGHEIGIGVSKKLHHYFEVNLICNRCNAITPRKIGLITNSKKDSGNWKIDPNDNFSIKRELNNEI